MRRFLALLMCMLLIVPAAGAEEEDVSLLDVLAGADPDVVFDTYIPAPDPMSEEAVEAGTQVKSIYEEDGSILKEEVTGASVWMTAVETIAAFFVTEA